MAEIEEKKNTDFIEKMFDVGAHFAYSKSRRHPSVTPYIFGAKNRVEIFDLEKTSELFDTAKEFITTLGTDQKMVLFVGGKDEARTVIKNAGGELSMPYVAGRWIGGTLTNFSEIKKRIDHLRDLLSQKEKGELETKYTKKERLLIDREIDDLKVHFEGLMKLEEIPQALVVVDTKKEKTAIAEAKRKNIPVIGLLNSDCDMSAVEYPVVANDATQKSISFFITELVEAYKRGMKKKVE